MYPAAILAVPGPSAERWKCSWHLGMMMRIIETLLLKGKLCPEFSPRDTFFNRKRPDRFTSVGTPDEPKAAYVWEIACSCASVE
jgi:hypothetical protein